MTRMRRFCFSIPKDIDEYVKGKMVSEEFCNKSYAEVLRILINRGIDSDKRKRK